MTRTATSDPGTPIAEIADEWMCPICGVRKTDSGGLEPGEEILED
jgi:rubredoxin